MSADPIDITEDLELSLDSEYDAQYERYLFAVDVQPPAEGVFPEGHHLFQIADRSMADWALRVILRAKRRIAEEDAVLGDATRAVMAKVDRILEPFRNTHAENTQAELDSISRLEGLLKTYHRKVITQQLESGTPDRELSKSVKLPHGTLKSTGPASEATSFNLTFGNEFVEWAKAQGYDDVLKVETTPIHAEASKLVKVVKVEGEYVAVIDEVVVPGVTVERKDRKFDVIAEPNIKAPSSAAASL